MSYPVDNQWLEEVRADLESENCDEEFIQSVLDDAKDGLDVTVIIQSPQNPSE